MKLLRVDRSNCWTDSNAVGGSEQPMRVGRSDPEIILHLHGITAVTALVSHIVPGLLDPSPFLWIAQKPDAFLAAVGLWSALAMHYVYRVMSGVIRRVLLLIEV